MRVSDVMKRLNATVVNFAEDSEITTGYAGDFLSNVMGKAPSGCCWFTVMTNVNVCAVAVLAEIALIVIYEGSETDENLINKAKQQGVNVVKTDMDVYQAIACIANEI